MDDAYGHEVWDWLNGVRGAEVIERDDGYIDVSGGPAAYFAPFRKWPATDRRAMRYVRGRVLDVGSGAGRWALHLQERGHDVCCIDTSPLALRTCRARGVGRTRLCSVTQVSAKLGRFDTTLMMGNNFGLFGSPARLRRILRGFEATHATRIVAASLDPYQTDNPDHLRYQRRNRQRGRMSGQLRIRVRYRALLSDWFDYLIVSRDEMDSLFTGTGWRVTQFIDSDSPAYAAVIDRGP